MTAFRGRLGWEEQGRMGAAWQADELGAAVAVISRHVGLSH